MLRGPRVRPAPLRSAWLLLGALLLLRGGSCLQVERPYAPPTAEALLAHLRAQASSVSNMRAETRMTHHTNQGNVKATVRLMVAQGGKLRFDAVSPFDTPLATLVSDGKQFWLKDARKGRHYHGPAAPCNIGRLLGVALEPDAVLTILAGSTPMIAHTSATVRWDGRDSAEVLTLKGGSLVQTIRLDGSHKRWDLRLSEIRDADGKLVLRIEPTDYRVLAKRRLPRHIRVQQPRQDARLEVTFRQQEINLTLPSAAFQPLAPTGMPSQLVECATEVTP